MFTNLILDYPHGISDPEPVGSLIANPFSTATSINSTWGASYATTSKFFILFSIFL